MSAHVAVIVLNWNQRDETLACLESVTASEWPTRTVILVDNGSHEDVFTPVSHRFPEVVLVRNAENLGFAGGMNSGIRRALDLGADYVLLLNNDTTVDRDMVSALIAAAEERPDSGIFSPIILSREQPELIESAGLRLNLRRCYQGGAIGHDERDVGQFAGVREVDAVSGAAMLVSATTVKQVGMLDESLHLYIEDVDWALRMRRAGRPSYVVGEARLWHGSSVSSGGRHSVRVRYFHTRNTFVVTNRFLPMRGIRGLLRHLDIVAANLVAAVKGPRPVSSTRAVLAGRRDYLRGRLGPG